MRLSSRRNQGARIELSMTSMIDVVFLLLIFFMVTSAFIPTEKQLDPAIRVEQTSASSAPRDLQPAVVELLRVGGVFVYRVGVRDLHTADELLSVLRQFPNKSDGAFVRVADDAPFAMAAAAIHACKVAGFIPVSYVPAEPRL